MTRDQYRTAALELETGRHGHFAAHIGEAYIAADTRNQERLIAAFGDLFAKAYRFTQPRLEIVTNE